MRCFLPLTTFRWWWKLTSDPARPTFWGMKHLILIAALSCASPAIAQDADDPMQEGLDRLGEGSRLLMEGLMGELAPLLDDVGELGAQMAPFVNDLREHLGDAFEGLNAYHPPEILPNGDIILRKKQKTPQPEGDEAPIEAPIEL